MNKIVALWKKPTETFELIQNEKINWLRVLFLFSCKGFVFSYYLMRSKGVIKIESFGHTMASLATMLVFGVIYGILSNLLMGFLIQITGQVFGVKNDLKKIYNTLSQAYIPLSFGIYIVFTNVLIARILTTGVNSSSLLIVLGIVVLVFNLVQIILTLWQFILIFKGLKVTQKLDDSKTILNYLIAGAIFGLIYYFTLNPYL